MNEQRKKLIELIADSKNEFYSSLCCTPFEDYLADKILEDGWVKPPCKVGEYVYKINTAFNYVLECKVVGFHLGDFPTLRGQKRKEYFVCYSDYHLYHIPFDDLGKTAFLSKEEAYKVLKERI